MGENDARTRELVQAIWSFCDVLRDDGITYQDYVTELSWLLFLCIAESRADFASHDVVPVALSWSALLGQQPQDRLAFYKQQLTDLARSPDVMTHAIFADAKTSIRNAQAFSTLVESIDTIDWSVLDHQTLGNVYEGLLERNATGQRSAAGQYFTPRYLVDLLVDLVDPAASDVVQDPAAGTGGFLVAAARHARRKGSDVGALPTYYGMELVQSAYRLCLMNLFLHDIRAAVTLGDTLSPTGEGLPEADVILSNPPFGTKRGAAMIVRNDFAHQTNNKQLAFLQHIYRSLRLGGRAAVIVPDGVLFDDGVGRAIREELFSTCAVHTLLRLPSGLFYAQGVKTNVLFFDRRAAQTRDEGASTWVYDARTGVGARGSADRLPDLLNEFADFYRTDRGNRVRIAASVQRLREVSRTELVTRGYNLDVAVSRDGESADQPDDPLQLVGELRSSLAAALAEVDALATLLPSAGT